MHCDVHVKQYYLSVHTATELNIIIICNNIIIIIVIRLIRTKLHDLLGVVLISAEIEPFMGQVYG